MKFPPLPKLSSESVYSSAFTNENKQLLGTVCRFYIYFMLFLLDNKSLFIQSTTKKYNLINIGKNVEILCPNFLKFCPILRNIKSFGRALAHPAPPAPAPTAPPAPTPLMQKAHCHCNSHPGFSSEHLMYSDLFLVIYAVLSVPTTFVCRLTRHL